MKVALILARKNSKRIKNKNTKLFCGKPMIYWPSKIAKESNLFDKIYVSTDSINTSNLSKKLRLSVPFLRKKKYATDTASTLSVVKNFIENVEKKEKIKISYLCCIYASAPFFNTKDLKESFSMLLKQKREFVFLASQIDSLFLRSFTRGKNRINLINKKYLNYRSQDLDKCYIDLGQFYWGTASSWTKQKAIFSSKSNIVIRKKENYIDINTKKDWKIAVKIFNKKL